MVSKDDFLFHSPLMCFKNQGDMGAPLLLEKGIPQRNEIIESKVENMRALVHKDQV